MNELKEKKGMLEATIIAIELLMNNAEYQLNEAKRHRESLEGDPDCEWYKDRAESCETTAKCLLEIAKKLSK